MGWINKSKGMVVSNTTSSHQSPSPGNAAFQFFFGGSRYDPKVFVICAELDG
jgi:hypothetical protein